MKKHYLVIESSFFVDPHGEVDFGGIVKTVEFTDIYNNLDLSKTYNEDLEEVDEDEYSGSEDGYNAEYTELNIKEITEEQFIEYSKIIEIYKNL